MRLYFLLGAVLLASHVCGKNNAAQCAYGTICSSVEILYDTKSSGLGGDSSNHGLNNRATSSRDTTEAAISGFPPGGIPKVPAKQTNMRMAHAVMASVAFVFLFPMGAIGIRIFSFPGLLWLHAGWMIFTYIVFLISMGMGVYVAHEWRKFGDAHPIIGLVVAGALILQPISGLTHHLLYKRVGRPNAATYPHVWWGRAVLTLGIINGGLGLRLASNTVMGEFVYAVIATFMWTIWMTVAVFAVLKKRNNPENKAGKLNRSVVNTEDDGTEMIHRSACAE